MPAFTSYVMVDWSAASVPRLGRDSIWIAIAERLVERGGRRGKRSRRSALVNLRTRAEAAAWLERRLALLAERGRVLVGFDFPFGYPAGTAVRLGLNGTAWRSLWTELASAIADDTDNKNNRFDVAEAWNRRICNEAFPFWGNVREETRAHLLRRFCRAHGPGDLPRKRLADARVPGAHPVWQLAGNGSVGSQALLGIPRVWQIRQTPSLAPIAAIWPFETGLADDATKRVILAESYPSLVAAKRLPNLPKDAGQVAAMVEAFARADAAGELPAWFAGDPALSREERAAIEQEEAWILGLKGSTKRVLRPRLGLRRRKRSRRG